MRFLLIFILCSGFLHPEISAQSSNIEEYQKTDSIIKALVNQERYKELQPLIDSHIEFSLKNGFTDSLYKYVYNSSRANWKLFGAEAGIKRGEKLTEIVLEADKDTSHQLQALNDLSWVYFENGFHEKAFQSDLQYLELCKKYKGRTTHQIFIANYSVSTYYINSGNGKKAIAYIEEGIKAIENEPEEYASQLVDAYNALAVAYFRLGLLEKAREYYARCYSYISYLTDTFTILTSQANYYNNLGLISQDEGNLVEAAEFIEKSIDLKKKALPYAKEPYRRELQHRFIISGYRNLAALYFSIGDYSRTMQFLKYAKSKVEKFAEPNDPISFKSYESFGSLYLGMGDYEKSLSNLLIYRDYCLQSYDKDSYYVATLFLRLGQVYNELGKFRESEESYTESIEIFKRITDVSYSYDLAMAYLRRAILRGKTNRLEDAKKDISAVIDIFSRALGEFHPKVGMAHLTLAEVLMEHDQLKDAEIAVDKAIATLENKPTGSSSKKKAETLNDIAIYLPDAYATRAKILIRQGLNEKNFQEVENLLNAGINELRKTKNILNLDETHLSLYESHITLFDLAQQNCFRFYEHTGNKIYLERMLNIAEENKGILLNRQLNLLNSSRFANVPDSLVRKERFLASQLSGRLLPSDSTMDLLEIESQYRKLLDVFKEKYPKYYDLRHTPKLAGLDDIKTKLLKNTSNLIQYIIADTAVYALVVTPKNEYLLKLTPTSLAKDIAAYNDAIIHSDLPEIKRIGTKLYIEIFAPLEPHLDATSILIVPDNELFNLNFETLIKDNGDRENHYLIYDYSISYLISATTALQFNEQKREKGKKLAAFAPGFSNEEKERYVRSISDSAAFDEAYVSLLQQPFAVQTALNVERIHDGKAFVEEDATEEAFKNQAKDYGILYLGTHTEINHQSPLLSRLIFSKLNRTDSVGEDGYLHAYEIYNMSLRAELAMLSACETGTGKGSNCEGTMSLAHSFAYAGCPSIVMALWKIDEKTSSEISEEFYKNLKTGMNRNEALRQAKLSFLKEQKNAELKAPYYWAGMILLGETGPISLEEENSNRWLIIPAIGILVLILLLAFRKRRKKDPLTH